MKREKTFHYCENCNKAWESVSPPTEEEYNNNILHINYGSVLINEELAAKYRTHAKDISGYYCDISCFENYIYRILSGQLEE